MVWEKAPTPYLIFVVILVILFIVLEIVGFKPDLFLILIFVGMFFVASVLEIWYVGGD
jgi:hypothetical protein